MAEVKRTTTTVKTIAPSGEEVEAKAVAPLNLVLPTKPKPPVWDINRYHTLIIGQPGTGKTTLGTREPGVFNLTFDPLNESYDDVIQEQVRSWREMLGWAAVLEKAAKAGKFPYKRVQIDNAGLMAEYCTQAVCERLGISHPKEGDYGQGFDTVNTEFMRMVNRLTALPCGTWFIAHLKDQKVKKRDGREVETVSPEIKGKMQGMLVAKCHLVVNIEYMPGGSDARYAIIRGDETTTAKCNIKGRFLTPDGRQVREILLGNQGPEAAWEKFLRAFNNGQRWADINEMQAMLAAQKAKQKARDAATAKAAPAE